MLVGTKTNKFSIGMLDAGLTDSMIDECGLREGLEQFGKKLIEQMKGEGVAGVDFKHIGFVANLKGA